ncbi:MAG: 50S ribosomal protein L31e [Candidatus Methanolliviera hydrocarbonicum]|uniref:Large ribosomal subunit protein eL31 n=1 Tax=Candidatus Methanolliviera hydrocarbonicum TaxID=2491085 RepID=A0A520KWM8_9EURY|nr:MAG: 50S ribosomal protein L31e [Candidatus Methanolliviera hydrocarbonicum]
MVEEERIYTIPLRKAFLKAPRWKRSNKAIKEVRKFLARHMKTSEEKVYLDASINEKIWERGSQKPPSKIRVRTIKSEDGEVETELVSD